MSHVKTHFFVDKWAASVDADKRHLALACTVSCSCK